MSFETLIPGGASNRGADFGFSISSRGKSERKDLRISISPTYMQQAGWADGTPVKLDIDVEENKGRLMTVAAGSFQARKLTTTMSTGRGFFHFPYTGEATRLFQEYEGIYELDNVEVEPGAITFDLPPPAEEEGEK